MSQVFGITDTRNFGPREGNVWKRQRDSLDHSNNESSKRIRIGDLVQDTGDSNSNSEASISPRISSGPENRHSSVTDSSFSLSCSEAAISTPNTFLTTSSRGPSSRPTHDTSRTNFHIEDLATFATCLEEASKSAFPNRGRSRYATVNACLIRWEKDEDDERLRVQPELERLSNVFEHDYGFRVEKWTIPTIKSHRHLMGKALGFINYFDARDNLFIVYYAGHGTINENRQSVWCCTSDPNYASVDWSAIQSVFDDVSSDVLILLDCCAAASSVNTSGNGVIETIAACGFERRAPPPGIHSFTNTLIEVLDDWKLRPHFSVSLLHAEVLFQLKRPRPEKGREGKRLEWRSTPVHYISSSDPRPQSIELGRIQIQDGNTVVQSPPYPPRLATYFDAGIPQSTPMPPQSSPTNSLTSVFPNGDLTVPHVLISVALEEDHADLNLESCRRWLTAIPAFAKYAKVQGVFKSYSTLLLLSLPVVIWNMLPDNQACCFIGFVTSDNLARTMSTPSEMVIPQAVSMESAVKASQPPINPSRFLQLDILNGFRPPCQPDPLSRSSASVYSPENRNPVPGEGRLVSKPPTLFPAPRLLAPKPNESLEEFHGGSSSLASTSGAKRSAGHSSGLARNFTERDHENHGIAGRSTDHQSSEEYEPSTSRSPSTPESGPFVCPTCKKSIKYLGRRNHELLHSRPFKCDLPQCQSIQGFGSLQGLDKHKRAEHPGTFQEKRIGYRCQMPGCGRRMRPESFRNHLNTIHQSELPTEEDIEDMMTRVGFRPGTWIE